MDVDIGEIAVAKETVRRRPPPPGAHESLTASIKALGVLMPILVRHKGGQFELIAGRRRLDAARAAGLTRVPIELRDDLEGADALAAEAAENLNRAVLEPIDQWRAIVRLQAQGYTFERAAQALGLEERLARRLDRLGRLHPKVLTAIERQGMPAAPELATIAGAPAELQAKALKAAHGRDGVDWHGVARLCTQTRIPRARAIFDPAKAHVDFEEDLFAQPGSDEQFTTADLAGFLKAQQAALQKRVTAAKKRGERIEVAAFDPRVNNLRLPNGWHSAYVGGKTKFGEDDDATLFVGVQTDGWRIGDVIEIAALPKARAKGPRDAQKQTGAGAEAPDQVRGRLPDHGPGRAEGGTDPGIPSHSPPDVLPEPGAAAEPEHRGFTQRGREMLAQAKTGALRGRLRAGDAVPARTLLACLVLAFTADNVAVRGGERDTIAAYDDARYRNRDLAARLVGPGGDLAVPDDVEAIAAELLARVLTIGTDADRVRSYSGASGPAAEWIGQALAADDYLPRFDNREVFQHVGGDVLRDLAAKAGCAHVRKVADLREALIGKCPEWHPAVFGAPGPVLGGGAAGFDSEAAEAELEPL